MITIVTGTVGLDKGAYLENVARLARGRGEEVSVFHIGQRMYAESPDVAAGRILDLPMARLMQLRRSVFKDIMAIIEEHPKQHVIINTHATFRWKHGLFPAFDFDHMARLNPDLYINLIDNVDAVHARLVRDHQIDHSLKDLMVWREEEALATEMMMRGCSWRRDEEASENENSLFAPAVTAPRPAGFYMLAVGQDMPEDGKLKTDEMFYRLMFKPHMPKVYVSFPMTHVVDMPEVLAEINQFRQAVYEDYIVFDPADVDEHRVYQEALDASEKGQKVMEIGVLGERIRFDVAEVMQVAGDIHSQIYARDFMMIDQADMIISYIPEMANGKPGLSSGVERELQHAHEATKEVYVIWRPAAVPSPFITETATKVFATTDEALAFLARRHKV